MAMVVVVGTVGECDASNVGGGGVGGGGSVVGHPSS